MKTVQFFVIATCNKVLRDTLPQTPPPPELCTPQFSGFFFIISNAAIDIV